MKIFSLVICLLLFIFSLPSFADAKTLPQAKKSGKATISTSSNLGVSVKLRKDKKALLVYFSGVQTTTSLSYMLTYTTNGQQEGAGGSVNASSGANASRELLFGTCSKNVCRYHTNISNMSFEVQATLKSGKKFFKRYKIKI